MLNFLTEAARDAYTKVYKQRIKNDEIACIKDTQRIYKFVNDSWEPIIANSDSKAWINTKFSNLTNVVVA